MDKDLHLSKHSNTLRRNITFVTFAYRDTIHVLMDSWNELTLMCDKPFTRAVDGDQAKWSKAAYTVFWVDRITIRRRMGCSPYFAVTGTHPLLPSTAQKLHTYSHRRLPLCQPRFNCDTSDSLTKTTLSTFNSTFQVMSARLQAAVRFERDHIATIAHFDFQRGDLVLVRNTAIEKR